MLHSVMHTYNRWLLRWRFVLLRRWLAAQQIDPESLLALTLRLQLIQPKHVEHYTRRLGMGVVLYTGFKNAEHILTCLDYLCDALESGGYVEDPITTIHHDLSDRRFDDLLVNGANQSIRLEVFLGTFKDRVLALNQAFQSATGGGSRVAYYQRKTEGFIDELFLIVEALEYLAFEDVKRAS